MWERLRARNEWKFFRVLPKADRPLVGLIFILLQVLTPIHQALGANLGDRTAAWLHDRLTEACIRPPGLAHLENPKLTNDLTVARDFDLGMTGPPLYLAMDFLASGLVDLLGGLASAVVLAAYAWWAPIVLGGARLATHWLLRESAVWRDRNTAEVRSATPNTLTGSRSIRRQARSCGSSDWPGESWTASFAAGHVCTRCNIRQLGCASDRCWAACSSCSAPMGSSFGLWRRPPRTALSTLAR